MAACSQGAAEAGGHVVGVTVAIFDSRGEGNPWIRERHHTGTLFERLERLVERADGFVAVAGGVGTLNEVFLVWTLLSLGARRPAPLILMGAHWREWLDAHRPPGLLASHLFELVEVVDTPSEAAARVLAGVAVHAARAPS